LKAIHGRFGIFIFFLLVGCIFCVSCKNDIDTINLYKKKEKFADVSVKNAKIVFTDSAKTKIKIVTPLLKQYKLEKDPYTEFPEGIEVFFFNAHEEVKSKIKANYAIYYEDEELWEARDDVVTVNNKGEKLNTEQMFWDQKERKIYSNKFTKIKTEDDIFYGQNGFVANQDMSKWRLNKSKGTVQIEDNE
jgi:LPS export ABC transporter protein LptC